MWCQYDQQLCFRFNRKQGIKGTKRLGCCQLSCDENQGQAKRVTNIIATKQRHRAATESTSFDMTSVEEEAFLGT